MRLAWLTDIHVNLLGPGGAEHFFRSVGQTRADAVLISGDIAVGPTVSRFLMQLINIVQRPVYFVLGNHDFWESSFRKIHAQITALTKRERGLLWLGTQKTIALTEQVGLLGHDGWYDGRLGDYESSEVRLNDFVRIEEFAYLSREARLNLMKSKGDEAAAFLKTRLSEALAQFSQLIVVTHVPPFQEAARYRGKASDPTWLPFVTCRAVGELLESTMKMHPNKKMTVLCGHTHGEADVHILPNLRVRAGAAEYRAPAVQPIIQLSKDDVLIGL